jgi:hypothetical protein
LFFTQHESETVKSIIDIAILKVLLRYKLSLGAKKFVHKYVNILFVINSEQYYNYIITMINETVQPHLKVKSRGSQIIEFDKGIYFHICSPGDIHYKSAKVFNFICFTDLCYHHFNVVYKCLEYFRRQKEVITISNTYEHIYNNKHHIDRLGYKIHDHEK